MWGSCGVPGLHPGWDPGSALPQGARHAVLALQPQSFLPPQHKSWKRNRQKAVPAPCHQLRVTSSWLSEVSGSCQSLGRCGLARAPGGGCCCPGDWSCLRGWSRWGTADAILGCRSVRLSQVPRRAGGPWPVPRGSPPTWPVLRSSWDRGRRRTLLLCGRQARTRGGALPSENPESGQPGEVARTERPGEARLPPTRESLPSAGACSAGLARSHLLPPWERV